MVQDNSQISKEFKLTPETFRANNVVQLLKRGIWFEINSLGVGVGVGVGVGARINMVK